MSKLQSKSTSTNSNHNLNGKRTYQKFAQTNSQNGRWAKVEHEKFVECLKKFGKNWKLIEQELGSRTGSQIRSHAQKYFQKLEKFTKDHTKCFDYHDDKQNKLMISEEEHLNNDIETHSNVSTDCNNNNSQDQALNNFAETSQKCQNNEPSTEEILNNSMKNSFFLERFSSLVQKSNLQSQTPKLTDFVNISPNSYDDPAPQKKIQKKSFRIYYDEHNFFITNKQLESLRKLSGDDLLIKKF